MTNIVKGSLSAMAKQHNHSLAESFLSCENIILVDTSGSMASCDFEPQVSRYDRACRELEALQNNIQGKIGVFSFSTSCVFCPNGIPLDQGGGTNLAQALEYVHITDGLIDRLIIISDGEPQNEQAALAQAKRFTTPITTIFIGRNGTAGEAFLKRLATAQSMTIAGAKDLAKTIQPLLLAGN